MLKKLLAALRTDRPVLMFLNFCEGIVVVVYIKRDYTRQEEEKGDGQCKLNAARFGNKGRHKKLRRRTRAKKRELHLFRAVFIITTDKGCNVLLPKWMKNLQIAGVLTLHTALCLLPVIHIAYFTRSTFRKHLRSCCACACAYRLCHLHKLKWMSPWQGGIWERGKRKITATNVSGYSGWFVLVSLI